MDILYNQDLYILLFAFIIDIICFYTIHIASIRSFLFIRATIAFVAFSFNKNLFWSRIFG